MGSTGLRGFQPNIAPADNTRVVVKLPVPVIPQQKVTIQPKTQVPTQQHKEQINVKTTSAQVVKGKEVNTPTQMKFSAPLQTKPTNSTQQRTDSKQSTFEKGFNSTKDYASDLIGYLNAGENLAKTSPVVNKVTSAIVKSAPVVNRVVKPVLKSANIVTKSLPIVSKFTPVISGVASKVPGINTAFLPVGAAFDLKDAVDFSKKAQTAKTSSEKNKYTTKAVVSSVSFAAGATATITAGATILAGAGIVAAAPVIAVAGAVGLLAFGINKAIDKWW